ncbi:hypothetical protein CC80DRAFT_164142 [Byssothecium circinans]|uniref:Uncharacterized protein n=1 Tax=Byssothecium circinans TaxID=147558 RepID=A0A6A5TKR1_9PLEO|nr:hypothetical protein CC80DRAFT_164142 [Byssothecium circinans]
MPYKKQQNVTFQQPLCNRALRVDPSHAEQGLPISLSTPKYVSEIESFPWRVKSSEYRYRRSPPRSPSFSQSMSQQHGNLSSPAPALQKLHKHWRKTTHRTTQFGELLLLLLFLKAT